MRLLCYLSVSFLFILLSGCSQTIQLPEDHLGIEEIVESKQQRSIKLPDASQLPLSGPVNYKIGLADHLVVSVWGRPDLGSQLPAGSNTRRNISVVSESGKISLPYIGTLKVLGLTAEEVSGKVQWRYRRIVDNPMVDVTIVGYRSKQVSIEGEVAQPGSYPLTDIVSNIKDLVLSAGGIKSSANTRDALLIRNGENYSLDYRAGRLGRSGVHDVALQDGDRIYFPSLNDQHVVLMGEVGRQRTIPIPVDGLFLTDALVRAGGLSLSSADFEKIYLVREQAGERALYKFALSELFLNDAVELQHNDLVFVSPTGLARWSRFWGLALPGVAAGAGASSIYYNFDIENNRSAR